LEPTFRQAFRPLIDAGFLRIVDGGADVGAAAIHHPLVDNVHITGSMEAHETIVWGPAGEQRTLRRQHHRPLLSKPLTSELGNVSPWIIVPGRYSDRQLRFQAENVAASLTNNAAFNCVSTRVLITSRGWPDRERFLNVLDQTLASIPRRSAYYPGAVERYRRFAAQRHDDVESDRLPWTLLRDISPHEASHRLREECFVCVCSEVALDVAADEDFLDRAIDFANQELTGTLCVAVTVPNDLRRSPMGEQRFQSSLRRLKYGSICINHWPGVAYAMITPPWGGYPGASLEEIQSGIGWVHNSYMLDNVEKSVLEGPLTVYPKPIWLPTHPRPEPIAWRLLDLYHNPSWWNFTNLSWRALRSSIFNRVQRIADVQGS
jgi:acyl-CoA reductase-like NAD-dependent aldehyde dehydrogenase